MSDGIVEDTNKHSFCSVALPHIVYAGPSTKKEFDAIPLSVSVHEWKPSDIVTMVRRDGQQWEQRVHSKALEGGPVTVIFQWFVERPIVADKA